MIDTFFLKEEAALTATDVEEIQKLVEVKPERFFEIARRHHVLIARDNSSCGRHPIIGLACLSIIETLTCNFGLIERALIDPRYADRGIAERLIRELMARGLKMGLKQISYKLEELGHDAMNRRPRNLIRRLKPNGQKKPRIPACS